MHIKMLSFLFLFACMHFELFVLFLFACMHFVLKCFYVHKNAVFFVFIPLYAFCAFCVVFIHLYAFYAICVCVKPSCKKILIIIKRFKIALIPSFTILLTCTPLNLPMESYLYALIFIYDHL